MNSNYPIGSDTAAAPWNEPLSGAPDLGPCYHCPYPAELPLDGVHVCKSCAEELARDFEHIAVEYKNLLKNG